MILHDASRAVITAPWPLVRLVASLVMTCGLVDMVNNFSTLSLRSDEPAWTVTEGMGSVAWGKPAKAIKAPSRGDAHLLARVAGIEKCTCSGVVDFGHHPVEEL